MVEQDGLLAEMHALRDRVTGITGSALASRDGLIIKADTEINQDNLAALAATSLGLAQRMAREVGQGALREAVTRSSGGYVAIYAVGSTAVLILTGDEGLNIARLHRESRAAVDRIETMLAGAAPCRPGRASRPRSQAAPPAWSPFRQPGRGAAVPRPGPRPFPVSEAGGPPCPRRRPASPGRPPSPRPPARPPLASPRPGRLAASAPG